MEGLAKFREAFAEFSDNYVIIGGSACDIVMSGTVVRPRATHDLDIIVIVENMTAAFGDRFWEFVREAGYRPEKRKCEDGGFPKYELYRFIGGREGYPEMIELLSRHQNVLGEPTGFVIEPLPIGNDVSSLSAIIMDDVFYQFTISHSRLTDGVRHADPVALIALKTKAYLNLCADRQAGRHVNSKDIRKHRSDVLKNVVIMEDELIEAPASIVGCIHDFVTSIRNDWGSISEPLAASLGRDEDFVSELLNRLCDLFISER